jgi:hypothetical protein
MSWRRDAPRRNETVKTGGSRCPGDFARLRNLPPDSGSVIVR